jgi:xanthine dehydrogenase accessory factor
MGIDLIARADGLRRDRVPFVLATVVRAERPTSARPGDRAVVGADGAIEGFVGGACATSTLRVQCAQLLRTGGTTLLRITPAGDAGAPPPVADGTVVVDNPCLSGGTLEILLEAVMPAALVYVFGDTPIARALAEVGTAAGYDVRTTTDPAMPVPPDATAVVVASHGHHELEVLRAALATGTPYLALVASPKRGAAVLAELALPAAEAHRVKTPAGLDIGARAPGDIAVSIFAELVSRQAGATPVGAPAQVEPATAVDPVCGMTVAVSPHSIHYEYAGRTWYFCAAGCRDAFAADPARYGAGDVSRRGSDSE